MMDIIEKAKEIGSKERSYKYYSAIAEREEKRIKVMEDVYNDKKPEIDDFWRWIKMWKALTKEDLMFNILYCKGTLENAREMMTIRENELKELMN